MHISYNKFILFALGTGAKAGRDMAMKRTLFYRIYIFGLSFVQGITLFLMGALTICSLFWGYYAEDMTTQAYVAHWEPFLIHLAGIAVLLLALFLLQRFCHPSTRRRRAFLLTAAIGWICFCGLTLILFGGSIPHADAASVYSIAQALAHGHTEVIHPTDSYLSYYPQQIGLVAFYEILIRLWELLPISYAALYMLQCVNVVMACIIVFFQYKITGLLFRGNDRAIVSYLFLAMLNAPLIVYTSFVYGEIPSFAFLSGGIYFVMRFFLEQSLSTRQRYLSLAYSVTLLVLGVAVRKNTLIVVIAVALSVLWEWLREHRRGLILYVLLLMILSLSVLPAIQRIYEHRAGNVLSSGVPAISYLAMGMQESSRGYGWYNGFNFNTYADSNLDTAITVQESKKAIAASLSAFREDPAYAFRFYTEKFLSQWTDGSYFCRQATLQHSDIRRESVTSLYTGSLAGPFIHYCNLYQLLVYAAALLCLLRIRRWKDMLPYVGMIAVLGGFLFHMIWEANSRYILPYFLLLLPYAAQGLTRDSATSQSPVKN